MNIYFQLFIEFFKTGLFSVGGGLATLPFLYEMSRETGWFTHADIADMIAISESTPGAIGINMSTYAGFKTAGPLGGIVATLSLALPSVLVILIVARFLDRFSDNRHVQNAFYGLRPASLAMVSAALINVVLIALVDPQAFHSTGNILSFFRPLPILMALALFFAMKKLKLHPIAFIAISAVLGIVLKL